MPGNGVEDSIHNLYNPDNSSQCQHLYQVIGGDWPVLDDGQWVGNPTQIGSPLNFNLKNCNLQPLDSVEGHGGDCVSVPFNLNHTQLTPQPEYSRSRVFNSQLNTNDPLLACRNFQSNQDQPGYFSDRTSYDQQNLTLRGISIVKSQEEHECADSPTLTTNSERSEITEASIDFNLLRGPQQLARGQQLVFPQTHRMQQSGYNDMQLLQQHMMFKRLQELQRQQQLQQLDDVRQQNSLNHLSAFAKQTAGSHCLSLISGTPVNDASQMLRNWMQRGASPAAQGLSNKVMFSKEQGQALLPMGLASQQLDASLYGIPISNTRGNLNQHPHLEGGSHDSSNLLTKGSGQAQKSMIQSSGFGRPYLGDQYTVPPEFVGLSQGALIPKQRLQMKNSLGQASIQSLNSGIFPGNLQEGNGIQANASVREFSGQQEQSGWPEIQQAAKQLGPSQGLVSLDPMEAKILYNMDDNILDAFGGHSDMSAGGFGGTMELLDSSNVFPSIQSGSWSALMQSAVAEASSSDTGLQEEWSGLTFQNTEHSTENQISNFTDIEKQQTGWVGNKLQSVSSFNSKPFPMITDSSMSSNFPGFRQPGIQLPVEQKADMCQDGPHGSVENYNLQQKPSVEEGQKGRTFMFSDGAWAGQMFEHPQSDTRHQRVFLSDISMEKGSENMGRSQHQISNGPRVKHSFYKGAKETCEEQPKCHQRENSNECYTPKGLDGHEHGSFEQFKFFGNVSGRDMNMDKGSLPDFQGLSRASGEVPSRGDHGSISASSNGSVLPDGSEVNARTSEHMLELLHKVNQSKDNGTIAQFGSTNCNPLTKMPSADSRDTSVAQMYNQSSVSQDFGLMLAPPSQRLPYSNSLLSPRGFAQTVSNLNSRQVNPEVGEKNETLLAPSSSFRSFTPPHELSQRAHWDSKTGASGQTGPSSYLNVQGNSVASFTSIPPHARSQPQMHLLSNLPVASQSLQMNESGAFSRYPAFDRALSLDTSQQNYANSVSPQFPVLEALPVSQPSSMAGMSQPCKFSARPHNVWRNVPTHSQPFGMESLKVSASLPASVDPSTNSMISVSCSPHGSNDQNSVKSGYKSSEFGATSKSIGFDYGEEYPGKDMSSQQISSKSGGVSQVQELISDATDPTCGSIVFHSQQQDVNRVKHDPAPASSERILETSSHSHNHHKFSLLHPMQAMNNGADSVPEVQRSTTSGGQRLYDNSSMFRQPMDGGPNSASHTNTSPLGDTKMLGTLDDAGDGLRLKATLQPSLQAGSSQEMVIFGRTGAESQSSSSNVPSNHTDNSHVNLHMAPLWFKQHGTVRNGQMVPIFDTQLAKTDASQFSLGQPSQSLHINAADTGQGIKVWPTTVATLVASQHISAPYMVPSETTNQVSIMRPKKRKTATSEHLAWHKEVMQNSKRLHSISMTEEDWAQATNRLIEKVEDGVETIDDVKPVFQSKRRLILTTQLMQQLFRPAPVSIFSADAASNYDIVSYFVSRLSVGETCSIASCTRNDLRVSTNNGNMNSVKLKTYEGSDDQPFLEVLEGLIGRSKKLENDFQRLDKRASAVDIRVDIQELERFAVINRFAKFHVRGAETSGTSLSSGTTKSIPQRYVAALPMPRNLPEGVQCLAL